MGQLMDRFYFALSKPFDWILFPFASSTPLLPLALVSLLAAVVLLLVFARFSDQKGLEGAKNRIRAHLLELRLFGHDARLVWAAEKKIVRSNLTYLALLLKPLVLTLPIFALMVWGLYGWFEFRPIAPGEAVVVSAFLSPPAIGELSAPGVTVDDGLEVETLVLRIPEQRRFDWRVRALQPGEHRLVLSAGNEQIERTVVVGGARRSALYRSTNVSSMPVKRSSAEPDRSARSVALERVEVDYPRAAVTVFGFEIGWLTVFVVLSVAFSFFAQAPVEGDLLGECPEMLWSGWIFLALFGGVFQVDDTAAAAGLTFRQNNFATASKYPFESMGGAVAALDFNNDGKLDLFFLNGSPSPEHRKTTPDAHNRLYRNEGGLRFTDVTAGSGLEGRDAAGYPQGVAAGDFDNDGWVDLLVTNYGDNILYRNEGNGRFTDVTRKAGVAMSGHPFKASACWVDFDRDGWLDLFVTRYFDWTFAEHADYHCGVQKPGWRTYCRPDVFRPLPNALFRNNGDGTFRDVSDVSGVSRHLGKGMGVVVSDYDADGWTDIFVVNDRMPNFLYRNKQGSFEEVALLAGVYANESGMAVSGMGADMNDYDNDGQPDLFYTDLVTETFALFRNIGKGLFQDVSYPSRVAPLSVKRSGWSTKFLDWDNDGWKDILGAGSHVIDNVRLYNADNRYEEPCFFFRNIGNGKFEDASGSLGPDFQKAGAYRGLAVGDFDNDGGLEAAVSRLNDSPVLWRITSPVVNHWIILRLEGRKSNRDGIGARIRVALPSGRTLWEQVSTANGIYSASDKRVHLGLGKDREVSALEIQWPGGTVQTLKNVPADQVLTITEEP